MFPRAIPKLTSFRSLTHSRLMSAATNTTTQKTFLVYAPDYTDEGALERRLKVRAQHMEGAKDLHSSRFLKMGGAFLSPESDENPDGPPKMIGSMLVVRGDNIAEVKQKVEADIYWTGGVWDKERLQIMPFLQAPFTER